MVLIIYTYIFYKGNKYNKSVVNRTSVSNKLAVVCLYTIMTRNISLFILLVMNMAIIIILDQPNMDNSPMYTGSVSKDQPLAVTASKALTGPVNGNRGPTLPQVKDIIRLLPVPRYTHQKPSSFPSCPLFSLLKSNPLSTVPANSTIWLPKHRVFPTLELTLHLFNATPKYSCIPKITFAFTIFPISTSKSEVLEAFTKRTAIDVGNIINPKRHSSLQLLERYRHRCNFSFVQHMHNSSLHLEDYRGNILCSIRVYIPLIVFAEFLHSQLQCTALSDHDQLQGSRNRKTKNLKLKYRYINDTFLYKRQFIRFNRKNPSFNFNLVLDFLEDNFFYIHINVQLKAPEYWKMFLVYNLTTRRLLLKKLYCIVPLKFLTHCMSLSRFFNVMCRNDYCFFFLSKGHQMVPNTMEVPIVTVIKFTKIE
ncbi:hypothetical protein AGLY_000776 [Aphis glycines]|uniref:Uncharacterized protein n=1 Tax=Aphis glycines TaxID=307491 RepID=A0A6G0U8F9_APHGL|nr:hypothetical protein AGLY_000776 [Aphis glycines]